MNPLFRRLTAAGALVATGALTGVLAACSNDNGPIGPGTTGKPDAPTNVTATAASQTSITVNWTAVPNATGYVVQRATAAAGPFTAVSGASPVTGTTYTDTGLTAGTSYFYRVVAVRNTDSSATSAVATIGTSPRQKVVLTGNITANTTLAASNDYVLSGFVKVRAGATLTIEPGTRIVGDTTVDGSSLWILQGAKIDAQGTAEKPIVFTSQRAPGNRAPGDWGGVIIIGKAVANRGCPNAANPACINATLTEGQAGTGQNTGENYAGGADPNDNSGVLRYVRIEFAGYAVQKDQELNGLSSYAVGRGTKYEYVESMSGLDDSFEFFGGSVDVRYLVSYESGDDHFDWTEGYNGRGQFLIGFQSYQPTPRAGAGFLSSDPRGFEGDGCENDKPGCPSYNTAPYSMPVWANVTLIGPGPNTFAGISSDKTSGATIRRGSGATLVNGILARWQGIGLNVQNAESNQRRLDDSLFVSNNLFAANGGGNFDPDGTNFGQKTNFPNNDDLTTDPSTFFTSLPAAGTVPTLATLDWSLSGASPARTGGLTTFPTRVAARMTNYFGGTLAATAYRGAADPAGAKWWAGWTNYARN